MNRSEEELLARYLEGEISPEEEAALLELLQRDPSVADRLEAYLRLDEGLRQAIVPEASGDALSRAVAERLDRSGGTGFFARQVVERIAAGESSGRKKTRRIPRLRWPHDRRSGSGSWTVPLMAAAALFALLILATVAGQGNGPPSRREPRMVKHAPPATPVSLPVIEPPAPTPGHPPAMPRIKAIEEEVARLVEQERGLKEERKKAEDARRESDLRQKERELARVREEYVRKVTDLDRARREEALGPKAPSTAPTRPTPVARIERAEGEVFLVSKEGQVGVRVPQELPAGWDVRASSAASSASVVLGDGTRLDLAGRTQVREVQSARAARGKRFFVAQGAVTAEVQKQTAGEIIFATPNAEAVVLGTTLRLEVNHASTVLEVKEGKVKLVRLEDGRSVVVGSDHFAEVTRGVALDSRPIQAIEDIVLSPLHGRIVTGERQVVPDWKQASHGGAFEAPKVWNGGNNAEGRVRLQLGLLDHVEFTFRADSEKEYTLWLRGCRGMKGDPEGSGTEWYRFDLLAVEVPEAQSTSGHVPGSGGRAYEFNGYGQKEGYWWVSGNADPGGPKMTGLTTDNPVRVKFLRRGLQVLRVYPIETPMRFDAVWLSATQKTRPPESQIGPSPRK